MTTPPFFSRKTVEFRAALLAWFDVHKRDLPWRRSHDPYAIWVSEIMLQQTRVAAVLNHYAHWMSRFPSIQSLAEAPEDEVLAAWSGLGYYRRARFLHRGAKEVVAEYGGLVPSTAAGLRQLPGIGAYTSAAIASIAFGESSAAVDGNVERVILRQTGHGEEGTGGSYQSPSLSSRAIQDVAAQWIDPQRPGDYNQAMMELGATVCLPRKPLCLQCPVLRSCRTRGEHPTALRKPAVTAEAAYRLLIRGAIGEEEVLLVRRTALATVMPGMWELPPPGTPLPGEPPLLILRHAIMQTNYRVSVFGAVEPPLSCTDDPTQGWFRYSDLQSLPLTGLARKILKRAGLIEEHTKEIRMKVESSQGRQEST